MSRSTNGASPYSHGWNILFQESYDLIVQAKCSDEPAEAASVVALQSAHSPSSPGTASGKWQGQNISTGQKEEMPKQVTSSSCPSFGDFVTCGCISLEVQSASGSTRMRVTFTNLTRVPLAKFAETKNHAD